MAWAGPLAAATPEQAGEFMLKLANQAIATLRATQMAQEQRESVFHKLLSEAFDLDAISRFVAGRHYQRMSGEQRTEYHHLFSLFLIKTYARRLSGYSGETFSVISSRPADEQHIVVRSRIERPSGPALDCDWRLRAGDNGFRIVDLTVEGVSMAVAQRQDFSAVIAGNGVGGLLAALRARTDHLPATAAR
jgi:phospholipid transport system substrate-binding protein